MTFEQLNVAEVAKTFEQQNVAEVAKTFGDLEVKKFAGSLQDDCQTDQFRPFFISLHQLQPQVVT